jgi:integrase/recombinase XerC
MVNSFLKYLAYEKRFSAHTLLAYEQDLTQFRDFIQHTFEIDQPEEATHPHIRSWIISLVEQGIQPRSINRKIACLRSYYKFLLKREHIKVDPCQKIRVLKTEKKLPQFVQENQMERLFDEIAFSDDFEGARDKLVLDLLYGTGIRLSELIGLKHSDISTHQQVIRVLGKRNKERVVPFSGAILQTLERYYFHKNQMHFNNESDRLIVNNSGKNAYPIFIYRIVKKYLDMVTTIQKRSPHVLRHTYATHLLNKGADLNAVKDLLGHSSLAATQVYTHNTLDKLKAVFDQAHPKA